MLAMLVNAKAIVSTESQSRISHSRLFHEVRAIGVGVVGVAATSPIL